jgi:hypothetical protein
LFDAASSRPKSWRVNAGAHEQLPRFEADSAVRFFRRHLCEVATSRATRLPLHCLHS